MALAPPIASSRDGFGDCEELGSHALSVTLMGAGTNRWRWPIRPPKNVHLEKDYGGRL